MSTVSTIENISKYYKVINPKSGKKQPFWALKNVSFELKNGISVGLMGDNGSGKSTLLKVISKIITPTSGFVKTSGTVATLLDPDAGFHDELTGKENAFVYASLMGISINELKQKLDDIIDFAGTGAFMDTKLRSYSNGMKMRLAFSIATSLRPDLMLIDEIFAVGDLEFKARFQERIKALNVAGTSILMIEHDQGILSSLCQEGLLLEKGKIEMEGSISQVMKAYHTRSAIAKPFG